MTLKNNLKKNFWSAHEAPNFFHLSSLRQMPNGHRMVDTEFFGNFSCSLRWSASILAFCWSLSTFNGRPLHSSSSRLSSPLQNFLKQHRIVCSLVVPGTNVLLMLQAVSTALRRILNSNKKIAQICFLSNIISLV